MLVCLVGFFCANAPWSFVTTYYTQIADLVGL